MSFILLQDGGVLNIYVDVIIGALIECVSFFVLYFVLSRTNHKPLTIFISAVLLGLILLAVIFRAVGLPVRISHITFWNLVSPSFWYFRWNPDFVITKIAYCSRMVRYGWTTVFRCSGCGDVHGHFGKFSIECPQPGVLLRQHLVQNRIHSRANNRCWKSFNATLVHSLRCLGCSSRVRHNSSQLFPGDERL